MTIQWANMALLRQHTITNTPLLLGLKFLLLGAVNYFQQWEILVGPIGTSPARCHYFLWKVMVCKLSMISDNFKEQYNFFLPIFTIS